MINYGWINIPRRESETKQKKIIQLLAPVCRTFSSSTLWLGLWTLKRFNFDPFFSNQNLISKIWFQKQNKTIKREKKRTKLKNDDFNVKIKLKIIWVSLERVNNWY